MARADPQYVLEWVDPELMLESDWKLLRKADDAGPDYERIPELKIAHLLKQGKMHLFRVKGGVGVFLTEVRIGPSSLKRLGIVRVAGTNLGWIYKHLKPLLQHTARGWGCQQIESMIYNPRLAQAVARVGAKAEAVNMVLEVD